jgi:hypothetical protein
MVSIAFPIGPSPATTPVPLSEVTRIDVDGVYALGVGSGGGR